MWFTYFISYYEISDTPAAAPDGNDPRADLIMDAHQQFPTWAALEDYIGAREAAIAAAVAGRDVDPRALARAGAARAETCAVLPRRLILHAAADLAEMIDLLQAKKEDALRSLDLDGARDVQDEIDEVQEQLDKEERHLLTQRMAETRRMAELNLSQ